MPETLVIAEREGHVEALEKAKILGRSGVEILAITARAAYALQRRRIAFSTPEMLCPETEINAAGEWLTAMLDRLEQRLDPLLIEQFPELKRLENAGPVRLAWWELHRMMAPYAAALVAASSAFDTLRPARVVCFREPEPRPHYLETVLGSPWPRVCRYLADMRDVAVEQWVEPNDGSDGSARAPVASAGDCLAAWRVLIEDRVRLAVELARAALRSVSPLAPWLVLSRGYDLEGLLLEELRRGKRPIWLWAQGREPLQVRPLTFRRLRITAPEAWGNNHQSSLLAHEGWLQELTRYRGVSLSRLLAPEFERFCGHVVPRMVKAVDSASLVLDRLSPAVVLTSMSNWREHVIQRLAALRGVPSVEYNHGVGLMAVSFNLVGSPLAYQRGWRWARQVLVQSDGVCEYMEKWHGAGHMTVPVGSAHLDLIGREVKQSGSRREALGRLGLDGTRPVVLYVPAAPEGSVRHPPYRARPGWQQWQLEERILSAADRCPAIQLVVKLYQKPDVPFDDTPASIAVAERGYRNCRVVRSFKLKHLLAAADLLIADHPSLTFFEMLTTSKPVVLCGWQPIWPVEQGIHHPKNAPPWRRVIYLETLEEIEKMLPELFRSLPRPEVSDDALLRCYGTHVNDGGSAARAREAIEALIA